MDERGGMGKTSRLGRMQGGHVIWCLIAYRFRVAEEREVCRVGRARVLRAPCAGSSNFRQQFNATTPPADPTLQKSTQYWSLGIELEHERNCHGARAAFGELSSCYGNIAASEEGDKLRGAYTTETLVGGKSKYE